MAQIAFLSPRTLPLSYYRMKGFRKTCGGMLRAMLESPRVSRLLFVEYRDFSHRRGAHHESDGEEWPPGLDRLIAEKVHLYRLWRRIPFNRFRGVAALDARIQACALRRAIRRSLSEAPFIWTYDFRYNAMLRCLGEYRQIHEVTDDPALVFKGGLMARSLNELALELREVPHTFVAVSELLAAQLPGRTLLAPNAVANEFLAAAAMPESLEHTMSGPPVIGVVGSEFSLNRRVDFDLLKWLARTMPQCRFRVVGVGRDVDCVDLPSNLELSAAVHLTQLPRIVSQMACGLVPYPPDLAGDPLKAYEFLALGKPVVVCGPVLNSDLEPWIRRVREPRQLPEALERALAEDNASTRLARISYVANRSWNRRLDSVLDEVGRT